MKIIEASLLAIDINEPNFSQITDKLIQAGINNIHYDVMDNIFVPNTAFNGEKLKELKEKGFSISVHLMVNDPKTYIEKFINNYQFEYLTFHCEAVDIKTNLELIKYIKKHNIKAGIAIKPNTDYIDYINVIKECDLITIMGVEPGFGGQKYIDNVTNKIKKIKEIKSKNTLLQIDGGVNFDILNLLKEDINMFVSGSFLVKNIDQVDEILKIIKN